MEDPANISIIIPLCFKQVSMCWVILVAMLGHCVARRQQWKHLVDFHTEAWSLVLI